MVFPVVLTPSLCSEIGLPPLSRATVICAAVVVPSLLRGQDAGGVSASSTAASSSSSGTGLAIVALRPVLKAAAAARLLSRTGGAWMTFYTAGIDPSFASAMPRSAAVMLASDPIAGSAVASMVTPMSTSIRESSSVTSASVDFSNSSSASQGPSREAVAAAAASLSRSLSSAAASGQHSSDGAQRRAGGYTPPHVRSRCSSAESLIPVSSGRGGSRGASQGRGGFPRQGSAALAPEQAYTGYFEDTAPEADQGAGGAPLAFQKSTPILPSERLGGGVSAAAEPHWRQAAKVPPPPPPRDVQDRPRLQHQASDSSITTASMLPSHLSSPPPRQGSASSASGRSTSAGLQAQSWREAPPKVPDSTSSHVLWGVSQVKPPSQLPKQSSLPVSKQGGVDSIKWAPRHRSASATALPNVHSIQEEPNGIDVTGDDADLPEWARGAKAGEGGVALGDAHLQEDEPSSTQNVAGGWGGATGAQGAAFRRVSGLSEATFRRVSGISEAPSSHGYESDEHVDDYPSEIPPPKPRQGGELGLGATLFAQSSVKANSNPTNAAASRRDSLRSVSMGGGGSRRGSATSVVSNVGFRQNSELSLAANPSRQGSVALE